jgi:uncharacterized protein YbbK (DUF523 family)
MKKGFSKATEYTGEVVVADIGIPPEIETEALGKRNTKQRIEKVSEKAPILVSACLLGVNCRYDGKNCFDERVSRLAHKVMLIPICPEQLGGLGTPREPMRIVGGTGLDVLGGKAKVVSESGTDVTENMLKGAEETLKIAKSLNVGDAILKARSPSCGCGEIEDGMFPGKLIKGDGVTTALLKRSGIRTITEKDLDDKILTSQS